MANKLYTQQEVQSFFVFSKNRIDTLEHNYTEQVEQWQELYNYNRLLHEKNVELNKLLLENIDELSAKTIEIDRLKLLYMEKCQETYSSKQLSK